MSQGVIMTRRQKCLLHPFYRAAQRHSPKSYSAGHWYCQGNSQQQLLYHGDIAPSVNSAAIFDAPTPCCGVNYRCRAMPSVNVALVSNYTSSPRPAPTLGTNLYSFPPHILGRPPPPTSPRSPFVPTRCTGPNSDGGLPLVSAKTHPSLR